jgi:glycosyltransferase involved in cell wall biosynthesis
VTSVDVSIVLPIHNQADHIHAVVRGIAAVLNQQPYTYELILVANGCRDRSGEACCELALELPGVQAITVETGGWGLAVRTGLAAAGGDTLCYTNSARTHPHDLVQLIAVARSNPEALAKAHRLNRDSFDRRLGSLLFNAQCRLLFQLATWDINATPKAFSRETYKLAIKDVGSGGDLFDLEVHTHCKDRSVMTLEVPIYNWQRHAGRSTTTYISAVRLYAGAMRLWLTRRQHVTQIARTRTES